MSKKPKTKVQISKNPHHPISHTTHLSHSIPYCSIPLNSIPIIPQICKKSKKCVHLRQNSGIKCAQTYKNSGIKCAQTYKNSSIKCVQNYKNSGIKRVHYPITS